MKKIDLNLNKNIFSLLIEFECYDDLFILKENPNLTKYLNSYNLIFKSLKNNENKMQKICDEINDWFNFFNKNKKINSYNYSQCLFFENVLKETKILNIDEKFIEKLNNEQDFKILPNILLFQLNETKFNISETNNYCLKIDLEINSDNLLKTIIKDNLNYMNGNKNHNFYELIKKNVFLILKNHFSEIKNLYFFNMDKINETYLYVMNWKFKSEKLAIKDLEITNKIKKINFEKNIRFFQDANENTFFDFIKTSALDLYCFCINSKINHSINKLENWTKKAEFWVDKLKREFNFLSSSDKQRKKGYLNNINPIDFEVNKNKNPFEEKYSNLINEIWEKTEDYIDECNFWINFFDDLEIPKFLNKNTNFKEGLKFYKEENEKKINEQNQKLSKLLNSIKEVVSNTKITILNFELLKFFKKIKPTQRKLDYFIVFQVLISVFIISLSGWNTFYTIKSNLTNEPWFIIVSLLIWILITFVFFIFTYNFSNSYKNMK